MVMIVLAFLSGKEIGEAFSKGKLARERRQNSDLILSKTDDIKVGDTLPDHIFENLEGTTLLLSNLLSEKCVLIVIVEGCKGCIYEIEELKKASKNQEDDQYFIFVSWANPRVLIEIRDKYAISGPFLYDHRADYFSQFDISTSPFNITINKNRVVLDVLSGEMWKEDFEEIIEFNRKAELAEN
jgi:peroxiredoxin